MSLYAASSGISKSNLYAHHRQQQHNLPNNNNYITPMSISPHYRQQEERSDDKQWQHLYILPVLLLEFLSIALTRAVLPGLLLERFDTNVYLVMGFAECIRGLLAFISCPLFGKLSDVIGRKICLLVTVAGTCAPVCMLALLPWETIDDEPSLNEATAMGPDHESMLNLTADAAATIINATIAGGTEPEDAPWPTVLLASTTSNSKLSPESITIFVVLFSLSGILSSTFTLVFAYISDTVKKRDERVSAYGLALATFGLSFTIGPIAGGYLAQHNTRSVFVCSFVFAVLDIIYIYAILPESRMIQYTSGNKRISSGASVLSLASLGEHNISWNPWDTLRIVAIDPFLRLVGQVAFLYYTALWAVISTLTLFAAKRFDLGPERLGELMSALGLSTMIAEAVLVRIIVPMLGEKKSMRLGLAAFCLQCLCLGFAYEGWHLFLCIIFSILGNLVYPSLSSLVSASVEPSAVGEALGAINGIKALTEGIGPLLFGSLMTFSEHSPLPGWPYLLAAVIVYVAYVTAGQLPSDRETDGVDEYIHELERKRRRQSPSNRKNDDDLPPTTLMGRFISTATGASRSSQDDHPDDEEDDDDEFRDLIGVREEDVSMLSEIEDTEDERVAGSNNNTGRAEDLSRLPLTFGSFLKKLPASASSGRATAAPDDDDDDDEGNQASSWTRVE